MLDVVFLVSSNHADNLVLIFPECFVGIENWVPPWLASGLAKAWYLSLEVQRPGLSFRIWRSKQGENLLLLNLVFNSTTTALTSTIVPPCLRFLLSESMSKQPSSFSFSFFVLASQWAKSKSEKNFRSQSYNSTIFLRIRYLIPLSTTCLSMWWHTI